MARYLLSLLLVAAHVLAAPMAMAEGPNEREDHREMRPEHPRDERRSSPEERVRREKNMERWKNLPPERREAMRNAARERVERMKTGLDGLIQQAGGDKLEPERREQIETRYFEARRELESRLRRQMDEAREEELPKIVEAIKAEFSIE